MAGNRDTGGRTVLSRLQEAGTVSARDRESAERARSNDLRRGRRSGRTAQVSTLISPEHRALGERLRDRVNGTLADVIEQAFDALEEKLDRDAP